MIISIDDDCQEKKMNNENLNELIAKFYDPEQVSQVADDIVKGDEIIASADKLTPDRDVIAGIKNDISARLARRSSRRMSNISMRSAVAAMIAIVAFIGIRTIVHQSVSPVPSAAIISFWGEDATASMIADELDEIENAIVTISLDEHETESDIMVEDLELEIDEAGSSFWKG